MSVDDSNWELLENLRPELKEWVVEKVIKGSTRNTENRRKKIERQLGIKLELEELGTYQKGKDTMHEIIIRMRKKQ